MQQELGVSGATVKAGSLRAGTQCCDQVPDLHFRAPGFRFTKATPTFAEDIVIPWEGKRLLDAVRRAASKIKAGQDVKLLARVSEGPEQRQKLEAQHRGYSHQGGRGQAASARGGALRLQAGL